MPLAKIIDKREMQYLYREGDSLVFMDSESYDQLNVATKDLGTAVDFLKEGDTAVLHMYEGDVVAAELPAAVELAVSQTEPGVQGDRVSGARKPATLETGLAGAGAVVRRGTRGEEDQGRHPHREIPGAHPELHC